MLPCLLEAVLHAPAAMFLVARLVYTSVALCCLRNAGSVVNFVLLQATPILGNRSRGKGSRESRVSYALKFLPN